LSKDYQKLLKELSVLKQTTKTCAAQSMEIGHVLLPSDFPADAPDHSRGADDAQQRAVALEAISPSLEADRGASINGQGDQNSFLHEAAAHPDGDGDPIDDHPFGCSLPPLMTNITGSSSNSSSRLVASTLEAVSRVSYISFLFQSYSTAVQQSSRHDAVVNPRARSPSDLQATTRCELLMDVAREVKALSDQVGAVLRCDVM